MGKIAKRALYRALFVSIQHAKKVIIMANSGLYRSENEHDACGVGLIAHIKGQKSHSIVSQGLEVLKNLTHRGAVGADPLQGDGAGILIQIPDQVFRDDMMT